MKLPIKIKLPEHFLEKEVRCGYSVTEKAKKIWAVELDLLAEFDRVCRKHDINYQIFAGTLLGAVRHEGFIPWDDDVDVCLLRGDYEKLLSVSSEFKHPYFLQTPHNDSRFFSTHSRLRNSETTGAIKGQHSIFYNNGIYIDVFVLDEFTESNLRYKIQSLLIRIITCILTIRKGNGEYGSSFFKRLLKHMLGFCFRMVSDEALLCLRDLMVKIYNKNEKQDGRVGLITHCNCFTEKYWLQKSEVTNSKRYKFENIEVSGPVDYDSVLKRPYGKYMEYPPLQDRGQWHNGKILFEPEIPYKEFLKDR